jgi:NAD(P)-dependent dehydrogenase (short-subunit alcohol dehydrogenase family)
MRLSSTRKLGVVKIFRKFCWLKILGFWIDTSYEHFSEGHLIKNRRIKPQDIANAVRWIASDESRFLTGKVINVDAGWTAHG